MMFKLRLLKLNLDFYKLNIHYTPLLSLFPMPNLVA